jgi:hypothetical protein
VTERVVDQLETVKIDEQHSKLALPAVRNLRRARLVNLKTTTER